MPDSLPSPADLSAMLAQHAEHVCRTYLPNGTRSGSHWLVGDTSGQPGRSLAVRIKGDAARLGRWTDYETGEFGDLLDIIRHSKGYTDLGPAMAEARRLLGIRYEPGRRSPRPCAATPPPASTPPYPLEPDSRAPDEPNARNARLIWDSSSPLTGTLGERYLRSRSIDSAAFEALRFHPALEHHGAGQVTQWPAIVAALTDLEGKVVGVHRTWLSPDGRAKADLPDARKMLGYSRGAGVRFRTNTDFKDLVAGEGIETVLSLLHALPDCAGIGTLSASLMPTVDIPTVPGRILIATDRDCAGYRGALQLQQNLMSQDRPSILVFPKDNDFNDDLKALGTHGLYGHVQVQLRHSPARQSPGRTQRSAASPPEPVIALGLRVPSFESTEYRLVPLQPIDRANLTNAASFKKPPARHQVLAAATACADIAKITAYRTGATKVLVMVAAFMVAAVERALREHHLEPLHPYIDTVETTAPDGTTTTARKTLALLPSPSD